MEQFFRSSQGNVTVNLGGAKTDPKTHAAGAGGDDLVKDVTAQTFMRDVVEASRQAPVLVDFWAPWCGPCKTLSPIIEKAVRDAGGRIRLVKINIDEPINQPLAQQLRIQSIPAVYAFHNGQPVDGFVGALPESQIKQFITQLLSSLTGPSPVEEILTAAQAAMDAGDAATAFQAYAVLLQQDPAHTKAMAGLGRAALKMGDITRAKEVRAQISSEADNDPDVKALDAALAVAEEGAAHAAEAEALEAKIAANPNDLAARYDLALAYMGRDEREKAALALLEIVRRNRSWNDEAARKQLVKLFEAAGPTDPFTVEMRRQLSTILFS